MAGFLKKIFSRKPDALDAHGHTPLQNAVFTNDLKAFKKCLESGASLNYAGRLVYPPLQMAIDKGRQEMAMMLIEAGADLDQVDAKGKTALIRAIEGEHTAIVLALLKKGADVNKPERAADGSTGRYPLHVVPGRYLALMQELLKHDANPNAQDQNGNTPLHIFVDRPDMALALLKREANPNIRNNTGVSPYMLMLEHGRAKNMPDLLKEMIRRKADLHTMSSAGETLIHLAARMELSSLFSDAMTLMEIHARDARENNILHVLSRTQNIQMIKKVLQQAPGLVNEKNKEGETPMQALLSLFYSSNGRYKFLPTENYFSTLSLFLEAGAHPNAAGVRGMTVLHLATEAGKTDLIEQALQKGADINLKNEAGETPLQTALRTDEMEVVDILLDHHADPDVADARGWTILDRLAEKGDRDSPKVQRLIVAGGQYKKMLPLNPDMMRAAPSQPLNKGSGKDGPLKPFKPGGLS